MDPHGNVHIRNVDHPDAISQFFEESNNVDSHNQLCRGLIVLEKWWVTQYCWFRLHTTIVGIHANDMFRIANHHDLIPKGNYPINEFAGVSSQQLLDYAKQLESPLPPQKNRSLFHFSTISAEDTPPRSFGMTTPSTIDVSQAFYSLINQNGNKHHCNLTKKRRTKMKRIKQKGELSLPIKGTAMLRCVDIYASHATSPSAHQATSKRETASRST
jgi:hypothetical protein